MKEYLWYSPMVNSLLVLNEMPAPGNEDAPHRLNLFSKEDNTQVWDYEEDYYFIGEI